MEGLEKKKTKKEINRITEEMRGLLHSMDLKRKK